MADRQTRILRVALFVSLAVNLAIAGLVAGAFLDGRRMGPPPRFDLSLGPVGQALDEADRRAILRDLRARPDLRPPGPRARQAHFRDLLAVLRAEPFERGEIEALLADHRRHGAALLDAGQAALLDRIAAMSPEERAAFADRLEAEVSRNHGRGGDRSGG